jgi:hypothetical protein
VVFRNFSALGYRILADDFFPNFTAFQGGQDCMPAVLRAACWEKVHYWLIHTKEGSKLFKRVIDDVRSCLSFMNVRRIDYYADKNNFNAYILSIKHG